MAYFRGKIVGCEPFSPILNPFGRPWEEPGVPWPPDVEADEPTRTRRREVEGGGCRDRVARTQGGRGPAPGPVEIIYPILLRERFDIRRS